MFFLPLVVGVVVGVVGVGVVGVGDHFHVLFFGYISVLVGLELVVFQLPR